jgi:hypothetical protein
MDRRESAPASLKLATWNLALPVSARRREAMRAHTDRERADIWVFTETHDPHRRRPRSHPP